MAVINEESMRTNFENMLHTFVEKNKNYGDSFELSVANYGLVAALTRISDKFHRFETLTLSGRNGTSDESVIDTLLDMATYCTMTAVFVENSSDKPLGYDAMNK